MALDTILPLVLFVIVSTITPGGATTLATASGAQFGFRRSVPLLAGIAAGLASLAAAAAAGLAGLLLAAPSLQVAMRLAGSAYLLWLAWKIARSGSPNLRADMRTPTSFLGGVGLLWLNPKGWAMALGAAASFAALASGPLGLAVLLGSAFGLAAAVSLSLWCLAGLLLARLLRTERQWRALNAVLGLLLVASILPMWWELSAAFRPDCNGTVRKPHGTTLAGPRRKCGEQSCDGAPCSGRERLGMPCWPIECLTFRMRWPWRVAANRANHIAAYHNAAYLPPMPHDPDLLILLNDVGRMLRTEADRRARAHGMSRAQWVMLLRLDRQPGLSQKELAELLEVEPITVARLADRLEARGLLERRPDPSDRRIWRLHLLPPARPVLEELVSHRDDLLAMLTARLDPQTIEIVTAALLRMRSTLSRRPELEEAA